MFFYYLVIFIVLSIYIKFHQQKIINDNSTENKNLYINEIPFNPRDENTYKIAKDNLFAIVDGVQLFEEWEEYDGIHKKYLSQKDLVDDIENLWNSYNHKLQITKHEFINKHLDNFVILCSDFSIKKSNLTINGYNFSIAQTEMMKYCTPEEKERLTDIIINHFTNKEKHHRLRQELFDKNIPVDNYLFADLCFAKDTEKEQEIMYEYYNSFEEFTSEKEVDDLLNNEYLNLYPKLKSEIRENLITRIG